MRSIQRLWKRKWFTWRVRLLLLEIGVLSFALSFFIQPYAVCALSKYVRATASLSHGSLNARIIQFDDPESGQWQAGVGWSIYSRRYPLNPPLFVPAASVARGVCFFNNGGDVHEASFPLLIIIATAGFWTYFGWRSSVRHASTCAKCSYDLRSLPSTSQQHSGHSSVTLHAGYFAGIWDATRTALIKAWSRPWLGWRSRVKILCLIVCLVICSELCSCMTLRLLGVSGSQLLMTLDRSSLVFAQEHCDYEPDGWDVRWDDVPLSSPHSMWAQYDQRASEAGYIEVWAIPMWPIMLVAACWTFLGWRKQKNHWSQTRKDEEARVVVLSICPECGIDNTRFPSMSTPCAPDILFS